MKDRDIDVRRLVRSLRQVFWGAVLCLFGFGVAYWLTPSSQAGRAKITGGVCGFGVGSITQAPEDEKGRRGINIDLMNDVIGGILILVGLTSLRPRSTSDLYRWAITAGQVVATVAIMEAALNHYIFEHPRWLAFLVSAFSMCKPLACFVFCLAMIHLCGNLSLLRARSSWKTTALLFLLFYVLPLILFTAAADTLGFRRFAFSLDGDGASNLVAWGGWLLLVPVGLALPWLHLFVSTSRMIEERRASVEPPTRALGEPLY